jgi:hypothetical protein
LDEKEKQKQELKTKDTVSKENVTVTPNAERRANVIDHGIQTGTKSKDTSELVIVDGNSKIAQKSEIGEIPEILVPKEKTFREKLHEDLLKKYF